MKRAVAAWLSLVIAGMALPSSASAAEPAQDEFFYVDVPSNVEVKRHEGEDFVLFNFVTAKDDRPVLSAYEGTAPDFPANRRGTLRTVVINGLRGREHSWSVAHRTFGRELLIELPPTPRHRLVFYIHFFYDELSKASKAIADRIISTTVAAP